MVKCQTEVAAELGEGGRWAGEWEGGLQALEEEAEVVVVSVQIVVHGSRKNFKSY